MTLYVFGDSFASTEVNPRWKINFVKQWSMILSKKLGVELENYGVGGSSLEYTYYKFNQISANLKEDDVVVIVLTDLLRKWIFKDRPVTSSLRAVETHADVDPTSIKHAQWYFATALNLEVEEVHLQNFLYAVHATTSHLKVKPLFICAFDTVSRGRWGIDLNSFNQLPVNNFALGSLWEVSSYEINHPNNDDGIAVKTNLKKEFRMNHMSEVQHDILADKIINYILHGTTVDLTTGFVRNIYEKQDLIKQGIL